MDVKLRAMAPERLVAIWSLVGPSWVSFFLGKELYWLVLMGTIWLAARKSDR
jgi:hypothetical protein